MTSGPLLKMNMNNYVHFKPRELGIRIFNEHYEWMKEKGITQELIVDSEGWAKLQMHEFMEIYGGKLRHPESVHTTVEMDIKVEVYHGQF